MSGGGQSQRTHLEVDGRLCGRPVEIAEGRAVVRWKAPVETAADASGLVHGSFPFGVADYAAMLAVNEPNVVLAEATIRFLRPVAVGEELLAEAVVERTDGKKHRVRVVVRRGGEPVLEAELLCIVPGRHVFETARSPDD